MDKFLEQEKLDSFDFEKSPAKEAYLLLNAHTPLELSNLYTVEDQKLMSSPYSWDYNNAALIINKVKDILESLDREKLEGEEKEWIQEILWFWYHHAISCAMSRYNDKEKARFYAKKALGLQSENHPNKITKLLDLLLNDKLDEAGEWAKTIIEEPEKSTALELIEDWGKILNN